ncbi:choice-of-anchor D domain-containing protein [Micromonospora sonneratiae]|uniref:Fibronectin type-III domain-containing protein n=1 Tax=Micromonospora sonneratiae TaxID=1184706 RepID=A0ABW3YK37_9ACTN
MFKKLAAIRFSRSPQSTTAPNLPVVPSARTATERTTTPLAALDPSAPPDYFGFVPNYANSPLPDLDPAGKVLPGTGIRKFVDSLPGLGPVHQNELGNYLPVAVPDTITYPGCDYYEIGVQQYTQQLHRDLQMTRLRGYRQLNNGTDGNGHNTIAPPGRVHHLGPVIMAHRNRPVRIKFINQLPTGVAGQLFLPVDSTVAGAGAGPLGGSETYPQNRAVLHLHGGANPWISDGTPDQWVTPAGQLTSYPTGAGLANVPDMPNPNAGAVTLFYPNQQSGRLLWLRDNTSGLSRLTVYSGQHSLYLLDDPVEEELVADGVLPVEQIPLVIEDKTFVPDDDQLAAQDPTWDRTHWGARSSLWFPHVYMPNQNPYNESGSNRMGRWDYAPWFWPPSTGTLHGPVPNPHHDPVAAPWQPPVAPGTPNPSIVPEAYLDTPLVNGCAYPYLRIRPKAYRFRILNACTDRALNLQLYYAASNASMWNPDGSLHDGDAGEVPMVEAAPTPGFPDSWPTDGRTGGVPDPNASGPEMIQIGNDGGLLPAPVVLPNQPVSYAHNRRATTLNASAYTLLLGPGERADVIVDFSSAPPGSKIILYNDCPAPIPAFDARYDYHTAAPDQTPFGGAPTSQRGYGPNTRTLLQFQVVGTPAAPFDLATLQDRLPRAYAASQPAPIVPQQAYDPALRTTTARNTYVPVQDTTITFSPTGGGEPVTLPLAPKAITEEFEPAYGRMAARLGVELPNAGALVQTTIPLTYADPPSETLFASDPSTPVGSANDGTQLWKVTHHGVATEFVHFHYVNVQLVNRVGRDGVIRPPDPNELGWKDTVRMNPQEDTIVAMRPTLPDPLPFKLPDSVRLPDPSRGIGTTHGFVQANPLTGEPALVTNRETNFGWAYAWNGQQLGHADADMARPMVLRVSPAAPTGLTATATPGSATALPAIGLVWTNNFTRPAATINLIQRATDAGFTTDVVDLNVPAGASSHTDCTVTPGTTYYYRIRAENAVSYSAWSSVTSTVIRLLAPTGLTATVPPAAPLRTTLTWTNRSFATSIDVQRATNPTFSAGLVTRSIPVTGSYLDNTVATNTTYYHRVRTSYLGAVSPWSNVSTSTTPGPPAVPVQLTATAVTAGLDTARVDLHWSEGGSAPLTGCTVQRAADPAFSTALATFTVAGSGRCFSNTGLTRNTTYYYRVRAFNAAGLSAFTEPVSVTTPH